MKAIVIEGYGSSDEVLHFRPADFEFEARPAAQYPPAEVDAVRGYLDGLNQARPAELGDE